MGHRPGSPQLHAISGATIRLLRRRTRSGTHLAGRLRSGGGRVDRYTTAGLLRLVVLALAGPAMAQEPGLEEIVVTGSRIARPDFQSASPIVSVTQALFDRVGSSTVESALNTLPQFVPAYTSTSNNPGNGGQANVDLRGLGPLATLVLLDGKRLMPANGDGVADLNIVPSALIESVEIITGGASAVYGSDALAGVVNLKLRREFDGVEIDGSVATTDQGDGTQYEAGLTAGTEFAGGRGSVMGFVGYSDRELLTYLERAFSRYPLAYAGGPGLGTLGPRDAFLPLGSPSIEEGRVQFQGRNVPSPEAFEALMASYGYAPGSVPYQRNISFNMDGTVFTQGGGNFFNDLIPAVANFRGMRDPVFFNEYWYTYNYAPVNALQMPLERKSAFARAEYELGDAARVYVQGLYAGYTATSQLAPTPLFGVRIPVTNPYVPADLKLLLDSRPNPAADMIFAKRLSETGPRQGDYEYAVYQVTLGVTGTFLDDWTYEAYGQLGTNDQTNLQTGNVLTSRIEELTFAPDGGVAACGGFDPFGLGSISQACMDYVSVDAANHAAVDQTIVEVSASGPIVTLPAGELTAAVGVFYKEDRYEYRASPYASVFLPDGRADIQGFTASRDLRGDDHNVDVYFEALVPLLANRRGAESLQAVVGYRLSDYASAGSFGSWKAELLHEPVKGFRLRGSYQQAVRAASVFELYNPQLPQVYDFFGFEDLVEPCEAGSPARTGPDASSVEALCVAQGVPADLLADFQDSDGEALGVSGGNPDLKQEEASTVTLGAVWTSRATRPLLANLQVSLDWYRIEIDDRIRMVSFEDFVSNCYDARYNAGFSVDNEWCSYFSRDPASGEIDDFRELMRNAFDWRTDGIDAQLDWAFDLGPGQLAVNWLVSWLASFEESVQNSTVPDDARVGTIGSRVGGALPEWKSNFHVGYTWRDASVGAGWRYVDSMTDRDRSLDPQFRVPGMSYFDLNAGYDINEGLLAGLEVRVGVQNLTDEDPPIYPSYVQANTDPSQYDVFGRSYFASLRYSF